MGHICVLISCHSCIDRLCNSRSVIVGQVGDMEIVEFICTERTIGNCHVMLERCLCLQE